MWDSQKPSEISEIRAFEFVIFFVSVVLPAQKHQSHYSYNINNKPDDTMLLQMLTMHAHVDQ